MVESVVLWTIDLSANTVNKSEVFRTTDSGASLIAFLVLKSWRTAVSDALVSNLVEELWAAVMGAHSFL